MPFAVPFGTAILQGQHHDSNRGPGQKTQQKRFDKAQQKRRNVIDAPGLSVTRIGKKKNKRFTLERSEETTGLLTGLQDRLGDTTSALRDLREQFAPGFGDLTQARVKAIRDAGSRTVGNLREELGRRRVAGSSFAEREIASVESQFAQQEELARAEAKIQEFQLTDQLIAQEFDTTFTTLTTLLDQGNFEASLLANLQTESATLAEQRHVTDTAVDQSNLSGALQLAGTAAAIYFSDRRLKSNIKRIGERNGYPWYEFDIDGEHREGVMSDEVPAEFVIRVDDYDMVNYATLLEGCDASV